MQDFPILDRVRTECQLDFRDLESVPHPEELTGKKMSIRLECNGNDVIGKIFDYPILIMIIGDINQCIVHNLKWVVLFSTNDKVTYKQLNVIRYKYTRYSRYLIALLVLLDSSITTEQ